MADRAEETRRRWAHRLSALVDRIEADNNELAKRRDRSAKAPPDPFERTRKAWREWIGRRSEPTDPGDRLDRHWRTLDDEAAPLQALRSRIEASEADLRRTDDAVQHVRRTRHLADLILGSSEPVAVVAMVGGVALAIAAVNAWMAPGLQGGEWHGVLLAVAVWSGIVVLLAGLASLVGQRHSGKVTALGLTVTAAIGAAVLARGAQGYGDVVVLAGIAALHSSLLLVAATVTLAEQVAAAMRYRSLTADPGAHVLVALGDVADSIGRHEGDDRQDLRWAAARLEEAAVAIEDHLASDLARHSDDDAGREWIVGQLRRRAAGLRLLQRPLYLPRSGQDTEVAELCGELAVVALDGRWGDLPDVDVEPVERTRVVLAVARSLVVAAVPLAVVAGADWFSDSFGGAAAGWAWVGAVGWCVILLLLVLDPRLGEKLDLASHLLPWLPRGGTTRHDGP